MNDIKRMEFEVFLADLRTKLDKLMQDNISGTFALGVSKNKVDIIMFSSISKYSIKKTLRTDYGNAFTAYLSSIDISQSDDFDWPVDFKFKDHYAYFYIGRRQI